MKVWVTNVPMGMVEQSKRRLKGRISQGDPKPSAYWTVEQLKNMAIVGLYREESEDDRCA